MPREPKPYYKKSHKRWYVKINGVHHPLGADEKEAWTEYHRLMAGRLNLGRQPLIVDLLEAYLAWCEVNRAPATYRLHRTYCSSFARSIPKSLRLESLKHQHVIRWVDDNWPVAEFSQNTRGSAISIIQRALNWAVRMGHLDRSPLVGLEKPSRTKREAYLWPEQYEQLLGRIRDEAFRDYVEILRHTGCRPKEARVVEAAHFIRQEECWILPAGLCKQGRSRTILLDSRAMEISTKQAAKYPKGPLLRNARGKPWTKGAIVNRFWRLQQKLDFEVTAYSVRHTFATDAILQGVDLITIAEMMGHTDLRMLSQVYQHINKRRDHLRKGLEKATSHIKSPDEDESDGDLKVAG
jgi:integrase